MRVRRWNVAVLAVLVGVAGMVAAGTPAKAHEGEQQPDQAVVLVRQAIALIVSSPDEVAEIGEKVEAAQTAPDPTGVDLDLVAEASDMVEQNDLDHARLLLEQAIGAGPVIPAAPAESIGPPPGTATTGQPSGPAMGEMATGAEPGGTLIADPLDPRPGLDGGDWALLAGSILIGLAGVWLVLRYRPDRRAVR